MLKFLFNCGYLLIFLRFLRNLFRKLVPSKEDLALPRYLILAMFEDKTLLLGYSNSIDVCHAYANNTRWAITISEFTGSGYRDIATGIRPEEPTAEEPTDKANEACLMSLRECGDIFMDEEDWRLMDKYGFDQTKIDLLVHKFRNGNYV